MGTWKSRSLALGLGSLALMALGTVSLGLPDRAIAQFRLPEDPGLPNRLGRTTESTNTLMMDSTLISAANTRFGFQLFSEVFGQDGDRNLMVSPYSVSSALSMLYNGAAGDTQQAMADTLELQGMDLQAVNQANQALAAELENADPAVQLAIANSLWARQGVPFFPEFLNQVQEFYGAEITNLDFSDPAAVDTINGWVSEQTQGKIPDIVDSIDPDQAMFLINAIYFKGNWTIEFDPSATQEQPFYLPDGSTKPHPLMGRSGNFNYLETEQFQAVNLPYGNERLSMYVFLPKDGAADSDLAAFAETLTAENWETWMAQFSQQPGNIRLPRFKVEYDVTLNDALQALGMTPAFNAGQADFSNLSSEPTAIDRVRHKTFIEVNEEGTEAAAVTAITIRTTSVQIEPEPFQMTVDRPFFYAIRDNQTGTVLFMGTIVNPEE